MFLPFIFLQCIACDIMITFLSPYACGKFVTITVSLNVIGHTTDCTFLVLDIASYISTNLIESQTQ